jgi:HAD superfamily phosphatase (TIGR01668 family)
MSEFRAGTYLRHEAPRIVRGVCPVASVHSLLELDPAMLARRGKTLVILDVDNTIVPWRSETIPQTSIEWLELAKRSGLAVCLLSNTRNPERLQRLASRLGVKAFHGKFKPNPAGYRAAMTEYGASAHQTVMIGDQLFTDVLGANRAGIDAIWVRPLTSRDFVGTKVSRMGETIARGLLNRAHQPGGESELSRQLASSEDTGASELLPTAFGVVELAKHPIVRQFLKFCVVGGSSTVIDVGLHWLLMFGFTVDAVPLGEHLGARLISMAPDAFGFAKDANAAATPVLKVVSASVAILNSFYWNRRWTFGIEGSEERAGQLRKFVLVSLLGMLLNTLIVTGLYNVIPGHPKRSWAAATAIATLLVAFWNFFGQKFFAFRSRSE